MKKLLILFSLIFLILGCEHKTTRILYAEKVEAELNSGVRYDELFMTFKFGDSKNVVNGKFRNLKKEGKLSKNNYGKYTYTFTFDEHEARNGYATFSADYHQDKLYNLKIIVTPTPIIEEVFGVASDVYKSSCSIILYDLSRIYLEKYGQPLKIKNTIYDINENYWINGNRQIAITLSGGSADIDYTDLTVKNALEDAKKNRNLKLLESSRDDI